MTATTFPPGGVDTDPDAVALTWAVPLAVNGGADHQYAADVAAALNRANTDPYTTGDLARWLTAARDRLHTRQTGTDLLGVSR